MYIYIYMYICKHKSFVLNFRFPNISKSSFQICSYIQKMTQDPINAFKVTIYNTENTWNTKNTFPETNMFQQSFKIIHSFKSALSAHLYGQTGNYFLTCFHLSFFQLLSDISTGLQGVLTHEDRGRPKTIVLEWPVLIV